MEASFSAGASPAACVSSAVWGASSSVTGVSGFLSFFFMPSSYLLSDSSWLIARPMKPSTVTTRL